MNCTFCNSKLSHILDMGHVALAGAFLKHENFKAEKKYPLRLMFCESCYSVQLADMVPVEVLFRDYFYASSATKTVSAHFDDQAAMIAAMKPQCVMEIGCNDGVLLKALSARGVPMLIGVDPSSLTEYLEVPSARVVNEFFTHTLAAGLCKADVVVANNVFAHVDDVHDFTKGVYEVLSDDGTFIMEAHHLGAMVSGLQYDWIYHEHRYYYSLMSLEKHFAKHGMSVYRVEPLSLHGGSMRYFICKTGRKPVEASVAILRNTEYSQGLHRIQTFQRFAEAVHGHRMEMRRIVSGLRLQETQLAGYGASGRANTMLQWCGFDVDYIIDDSPVKQGFYTPGTHIPIHAKEHMDDKRPECIVIFAWSYLDEIARRCSSYTGSMLVPLPKIRTRRMLEHRGKRVML